MIQKDIGKIVLTQEKDRIKVEFVFSNDTVTKLFELFQPEDKEVFNFDTYILDWWNDQGLPVTTYVAGTYSGLRTQNRETLVYWNVNNKLPKKYAAFNVKTKIIKPLLSTITSENETKQVVYLKHHNPITVDHDTRFSSTKRVRLETLEEVETFLSLLLPLVNQYLTTLDDE
jgi:hypothetical protein